MGEGVDVSDVEIDIMLDEMAGDREEKKGMKGWQIAIFAVVVGAILLVAFGLLRYFMVSSYGP